ncbi:DTD2-like protein [Mya arenaria]|uniref:D-aminoacyl-tRNA deacylase n=2 Tax=Mya arenaria TaxID=6604 RepID=A0ABY7FG95_MYAAR|nr:D-aminoacyl-tRNA deacylase 2-like isoform X2 [Mya arenaria]XP_052767603.1 D-aminoacyl-tRNA deacylase 2-like isoform X2 [Mya arenaria]XP_052767605.1 D-aminoacyl-tRNA deacylase 2-like isoform X2 [Mya arenaria]XP_052767606.1 D-aminoacyl-tRNA deacylase 2-like isoform X2 [Mya arenaria]WAR19761.1 DTD2-like protein [Mya arenaria]
MSAEGNGNGSSYARVILQQCLSARLMVQPATESEDAEYVQIGRGLIVYVCFLKGASETMIDKMVKSVLEARLSEPTDGGRLVSILDLPGDVMIIPQATLGGSLKGKVMQYHGNVQKDDGLRLYTQFVEKCEKTVAIANVKTGQNSIVRYGTYGNRQVFSTETNGPYTHYIEF